MKKLTAAIILLACMNAQVMAFTSIGAPDCGQWIKEPNALKRIWVLGYMSGISAMFSTFRPEQGDPLGQISSAEQIYLWMDNYCTKNPLGKIIDGGSDLYLELIAKSKK